MKTVTLEVRNPDDSMADFARSWKTGRADKSARINFASPELVWKEGGGIVFPFEAVKVEFLLQAD